MPRTRWHILPQQVITIWAIFGGLVLIAVTGVNVAAVILAAFGLGFAGDIELTQIGVACAGFAFLPYCQLHRHNMRVDLLAKTLGSRPKRVLDSLASAIALGFGALLLWRMYFGMLDQYDFGYSSTILQIPIWVVFVPVLASLMLLVIAAVITVIQDIAGPND
jgi:TRAP-type C4-dicarboxylate transport system permease small subunit